MRTIEGFHHTMLSALNLTPVIADGYAIDGLSYIYGPDDGRVFLTLKSTTDKNKWHSDEWVAIDTIEAGKVEVRRADCGAGCKCAVEIRPILLPSQHLALPDLQRMTKAELIEEYAQLEDKYLRLQERFAENLELLTTGGS